MSDVAEMVAWLRGVLDAAEEAAMAAGGAQWMWHSSAPTEIVAPKAKGEFAVRIDVGTSKLREHIVLHDPAHELAIVAAHRAVLDLWEDVMRNEDHHAGWVADEAVRLVATGYRQRSGFKQEWLT